jgi:phage tail-like protein
MEVDQKLRNQAHGAFRFVVEIDNKPVGAFTECTLPVIELEVEEVKEGGLNTYIHMLPGRRRSARITLKNGVGMRDLLAWYTKTLGGKFERKSVNVTLRDAKGSTVMVWQIAGALPVKWTGPQLNSSGNTVAIETLDLVCGDITFS